MSAPHLSTPAFQWSHPTGFYQGQENKLIVSWNASPSYQERDLQGSSFLPRMRSSTLFIPSCETVLELRIICFSRLIGLHMRNIIQLYTGVSPRTRQYNPTMTPSRIKKMLTSLCTTILNHYIKIQNPVAFMCHEPNEVLIFFF